MVILSWIYVVLAVVLLFGATIFIHELGHFLVAYWRGLRIDGFSIGFGPKIFGWKRNGIEYAVRWIPAGGFVALPQMASSEMLEGKVEDADKLPPISPWSKILVAVAGPAMNAIFAFVICVLIYFVGLPVLVNPAIIGGVRPGSPEEKAGVRPGDRIVAVNGKMVRSWEDAEMTTAMAPTNLLAVTLERSGMRTNVLLPATVNEQLDLKLLDLDPQEHPVVKELMDGKPAEKAGVQVNDELISLNGVPIVGQGQFANLVGQSAGKACKLVVSREGKPVELKVTPELDPKTQSGRIGIAMGSSGTTVYQLQRPGPLPWNLMGEILGQTFGTVTALFHSKQTGVGVKDLSGPPGILAMLALELKTDFRLGLRFMVLLNVSLAILNLLPLPLLDGGHILLSILERVRGRPLSPKVAEVFITGFAALLISFMLYVSYNDIVRRLPLLRTMFKQDVRIEQAGGTNSAAP